MEKFTKPCIDSDYESSLAETKSYIQMAEKKIRDCKERVYCMFPAPILVLSVLNCNLLLNKSRFYRVEVKIKGVRGEY